MGLRPGFRLASLLWANRQGRPSGLPRKRSSDELPGQKTISELRGPKHDQADWLEGTASALQASPGTGDSGGRDQRQIDITSTDSWAFSRFLWINSEPPGRQVERTYQGSTEVTGYPAPEQWRMQQISLQRLARMTAGRPYFIERSRCFLTISCRLMTNLADIEAIDHAV
jgi:hypothetical protein